MDFSEEILNRKARTAISKPEESIKLDLKGLRVLWEEGRELMSTSDQGEENKEESEESKIPVLEEIISYFNHQNAKSSKFYSSSSYVMMKDTHFDIEDCLKQYVDVASLFKNLLLKRFYLLCFPFIHIDPLCCFLIVANKSLRFCFIKFLPTKGQTGIERGTLSKAWKAYPWKRLWIVSGSSSSNLLRFS